MSLNDKTTYTGLDANALRARMSAIEDQYRHLRFQLEVAERTAQSFARNATKKNKANRSLATKAARSRKRLEGLRNQKSKAAHSARELGKLARRRFGRERELRTSIEDLQSLYQELNLGYAQLEKERKQLRDSIDERTEELKLERDLFQTILETAPYGILIVDAQSIVRNVNPTAERMFGFAQSDLRRKNVSMLFPQFEDGPEDFFVVRARSSTHTPSAYKSENLFARRRDGTVFPVDLVVGETHFDGHRLFIGFVRDVTGRKRAASERRKLYADLAHAGRLVTLGEMATAIAHEINQPLTAISNYAAACDRLIDDGRAPFENIKNIHAKIGGQVQRMGEIIRHFRSFGTGGEIERKPINLNATVEGVLPLALVGGTELGMSVDLMLDRRLPIVMASPIEIQQVVLNFVRNAIDAMAGQHEPRMVIRTRNNARQRCVEFSVHDSGHGLKPEVAATLFDPFVTTKANGMGIGLALCRTIIDRHNGRIWGESNAMGGATFCFTLPLGTDEHPDATDRARA